MNRLFRIVSLLAVLSLASGCVYFNTFYHARKAFNEAESKRREAGRQGKKAGAGQYKKAIEKAEKVIEKWPNSKWYDDALYVSGVSHYHTEKYSKAEKRFRELIANFPESKYSKEARLYLAKSKLRLGEEADAMTQFEDLFLEGEESNIKAEAALALGEYYFEMKEYKKAEPYFLSLVDSLGNDEEKVIAKTYIADGYFSQFRYKQALDNYLETSEYELTSIDEYKVTFRVGECYYFLNNIETGMEYFHKLAENELYYDSLPSIKLMIAQGHDWEGELELAVEVYEQIATENPRSRAGSLANYYLGLINQFEYEDYKRAKEYFDKAKMAGSGSDIYQDALQYSSNIGKLEEYLNRKELDTTATEEEIDKTAETQYLLAELYLYQLDKPDSALQEFQYIIDNFPDAYLAPKALIATALMQRDYYSDTVACDSTLRRVFTDYPKSDFIPEAIALLGLAGTLADTGYAEYYYSKAESFAVEHENLDSARYYFSIVADSFPRSKLNNQAKFALLWLTEMLDSPGDSSLYYAYAYFSDSFPDTEFGKTAGRKLVIKPKIARDEEGDLASDSLFADAKAYENVSGEVEDSTEERYLTPEEKYSLGPDGKTLLWEVGQAPSRFDKEFIYPTAAYYLEFEGYLYFQVRIDPFGDVADIKLMNPTESEDLNEEVTETVLSAHFETFWIPPEMVDSWFVYKYMVQLPSRLR